MYTYKHKQRNETMIKDLILELHLCRASRYACEAAEFIKRGNYDAAKNRIETMKHHADISSDLLEQIKE